MGWDSSTGWSKKSDVITEVTNHILRTGWTINGFKSTSQGAYWHVTTPRNSFIFCALIKRSGKRLFCKTMSEMMGPAMSDCPKQLLDMPSTADGFSAEFRARQKHKGV